MYREYRMYFYRYFWYLKTAILGPWKSLKTAWILSFRFAMNPDQCVMRNTNLIDVVSCLGRRLDVWNVPLPWTVLSRVEWDLSLRVQVHLVTDQDERHELTVFHLNYLLTEHITALITSANVLYQSTHYSILLARDSIYAIARYMPSPVRLSVCLSVRHTGGLVKDGSR